MIVVVFTYFVDFRSLPERRLERRGNGCGFDRQSTVSLATAGEVLRSWKLLTKESKRIQRRPFQEPADEKCAGLFFAVGSAVV
jgi:hypothetical protein